MSNYVYMSLNSYIYRHLKLQISSYFQFTIYTINWMNLTNCFINLTHLVKIRNLISHQKKKNVSVRT